MLRTAVLALSVISAGCVSIDAPGAGSTFVDPDGKQWFRYAMPKGSQASHASMISQDLAWRKFCLAGYTITSQTAEGDAVIYVGECKK